MNYIQKAVEKFVQKHNTTDPYELASAERIEVIEYPFTKVNGMVMTIADILTIALNSNLSEEMKRAVLAHELGHYLLSPSGTGYYFISENTLMESKIEYEANQFMFYLLIGDKRPKENETLEQFRARVRIPEEVMKFW